MRRLPVGIGLALGFGLACAGLGRHDPVGPKLPEAVRLPPLDFDFAAPEMVSVRPGDTLAAIASRHGVSEADLRAWNSVERGEVAVGEVLFVWPSANPPSAPRAAADRVVARVDALAPADDIDAPPPPTGVVIERPAVAGLLNMPVGSDIDLSGAAAGLERMGGQTRSELGARSLNAGSTAEALVLPARSAPAADPNAPGIPDRPVVAPRLTRPTPKPCLSSGPDVTEIGADGSVSAGAGLTVDQIRQAMAQIGRHVIRCFPSGTRGTYVVNVEMTAGCDGRVSDVRLLDAAGVPPAVTGCVTSTLGYAAFPAHGLSGGVSFEYPIRFSF